MSQSDSGLILDRLKSLFPKSIDLTLNRPRRLLAELGHPEDQMPPVVHFAGTNGKGSTLAMVRAGLEAAGLDVHAYISPHLAKFHERIRLAGQLIEEDALAEVLSECEKINRGRPISLFEITTCAAMLAFSRSRADMLLLEVGLGGRLDATNVVRRPALTVISPVSLDHQHYLGETIGRIAREKAGILKPGVPCVVNEQLPEAMSEIRASAERVKAPLLVQGVDWWVEPFDGGLRHVNSDGEVLLPRPGLIGPHQIGNAGAAVTVLRHIGVSHSALTAALTRASWPARMQKLKRGPLIDAAGSSEVWLDGGHNPAAGTAVAETLREMPARANRLVCGMLKGKDIHGYLKALRCSADSLYGVVIPGEDSSLSASAVALTASELGFRAKAAPTTEEAVRQSAAESPGARILVCGSLYLAGRVLRENS
ncbi:MAG: bifunctional folylpolyglutamate synthase/dihydrofolate synthase [Rhodobacteraceae bacterium]|nr:bifunctional folylpolyglutamate synthase/dihydrofolate synthase [Paracoccaceae bacterium]